MSTPRPGRRHPRRDTPATLQLRAQLEGAFPPVWRRIEVASDLGLDELHAVLQVVFGWEDYHLYRFTTGPQNDPDAAFVCTADLTEGFDDDAAVPTWDVRVDELLAEPGERLHYQYDYGDDWQVSLEVEDIVDGSVPPGRAALVEGDGAGPPEDCGGIHGYRLIVAASDPAHPDHRRALSEVAELWGDEVAQRDLGLVAFDPAAIDARLQALDLAASAPTPARIGGKLGTLLLRVRDPDTDRQLRRLASSAGVAADLDEATAARMVRPFTVLLDTVGDGVKLTAAGYLPPKVVQTIFDELDLGEEWIGKGNREDLTVPVLELREAAQQLKLLRKYKGRLLPTARGRELASDPVGLWWHLAAALPFGGRDASEPEWQAGVLLLAVMTSGSTDNAEVTVARLLTGLGWAVGDGQPIDRRTVTGLIATDVRLLQRLGAFERDRRHDRWPGRVTDGGMTLARAALADHRP